MTAIRGAAAAVTGAASGIGRALSLELAARGRDLALSDRDEVGLRDAAAENGGRSRSPCIALMSASPRRLRRSRKLRYRPIAASTSSSTMPAWRCSAINEIDQAQMDWLFNINIWGVVHATRAFLPHLSGQRD